MKFALRTSEVFCGGQKVAEGIEKEIATGVNALAMTKWGWLGVTGGGEIATGVNALARKELKTGIKRKSRFILAVTFDWKSKTSLAGLSVNLTSATAETSLFANGKKINLKIKFLSLFLHGQGQRFFTKKYLRFS